MTKLEALTGETVELLIPLFAMTFTSIGLPRLKVVSVDLSKAISISQYIYETLLKSVPLQIDYFSANPPSLKRT